jgi:hypothetical protein
VAYLSILGAEQPNKPSCFGWHWVWFFFTNYSSIFSFSSTFLRKIYIMHPHTCGRPASALMRDESDSVSLFVSLTCIAFVLTSGH